MKTYAITAFGHPAALMCVEEPVPRGTEVLVEVTRCGVCHTDISIQKGYYDLGGGKRYEMAARGVTPPICLGHEIAGRIVAHGPDAEVGPDDVGRDVVVYPWIGCGTCQNCRTGQENLCLAPRFLGLQRPGGHAERILVPHARYLVDIKGVDPALAATYACSGLTSYGALKKLGPEAMAWPLLIIGAGGLGQSALSIARAMGFTNIIVADIDPVKREIARAARAHEVVDPAAEGKALAGIANAVDFVGNTASATFGLSTLVRGGRYVLVGLLGGEIPLALPPIALRPISILGSLTGSLEDLRELIALAKRGVLAPFEVETLPRSRTNDALDRVRKGEVRGRLVLSSDD